MNLRQSIFTIAIIMIEIARYLDNDFRKFHRALPKNARRDREASRHEIIKQFAGNSSIK